MLEMAKVDSYTFFELVELTESCRWVFHDEIAGSSCSDENSAASIPAVCCVSLVSFVWLNVVEAGFAKKGGGSVFR